MALTREQIALRVAQDLWDGAYVNLGVGIPALVSQYTPAGCEVIYHAENGVLGLGPPPKDGIGDPDLVNAAKRPTTVVPGGAFFHQADSFAMARSGRIDVAVLGALQVSEAGDLANWVRPGQLFGGIGGAADIAVGSKRVYATMSHTTDGGEPKILKRCTYPLTAIRVVKRIFTDLAVIDVTPEGLVLTEVAPGVSPGEVQAKTEPRLRVAGSLKEIALPAL